MFTSPALTCDGSSVDTDENEMSRWAVPRRRNRVGSILTRTGTRPYAPRHRVSMSIPRHGISRLVPRRATTTTTTTHHTTDCATSTRTSHADQHNTHRPDMDSQGKVSRSSKRIMSRICILPVMALTSLLDLKKRSQRMEKQTQVP